jgi:hypothetical protein
MTTRKILTHWTEVHRVEAVEADEVKVTTCCCAAPGIPSRKGCAVVAGNKTPCRCACHPKGRQKASKC